MTNCIKDLCTAIFTGPTGCGKSDLVLDLIDKEYFKHFDYIIIICPTIQWNKIQHVKGWIRHDDKVRLTESEEKVFQWLEKCSLLVARSETSFIIDNIIADKSLDKRKQSLLELSFLGRHRNHYLQFLTIPYSAVPKNLRRQAKAMFVWYLKERAGLKMIHDENNALTDDELVVVRDSLKMPKHTSSYIQMRILMDLSYLILK